MTIMYWSPISDVERVQKIGVLKEIIKMMKEGDFKDVH
jgi:hypothetical protein